MPKTSVVLKDGMHFMGELGGFAVPIDSDENHGGQNKGMRPKGLMLTALAGCTALDVIGMLRKMRIEPEAFTVEAESDVTEAHPRVFKRVLLTYRLKGPNIPLEKVEKAVQLSQETYCGVTAMLQKAVPIDYKIILE